MARDSEKSNDMPTATIADVFEATAVAVAAQSKAFEAEINHNSVPARHAVQDSRSYRIRALGKGATLEAKLVRHNPGIDARIPNPVMDIKEVTEFHAAYYFRDDNSRDRGVNFEFHGGPSTVVEEMYDYDITDSWQLELSIPQSQGFIVEELAHEDVVATYTYAGRNALAGADTTVETI